MTEVNAALAVETETETAIEYVRFSCHPLRSLNFGTLYRFENGILSLLPEDVEEFERLLEGQDFRTKSLVHKIDVDMAEAYVRDLLKSGATKGVDSASFGDQQAATQVGTEQIGTPAEAKLEPTPGNTTSATGGTSGIRLPGSK